MTQDTYENRALFMVMWYGATSKETKERFPEWYRQRMRLPFGSVEDQVWEITFCREAFDMRKTAE